MLARLYHTIPRVLPSNNQIPLSTQRKDKPTHLLILIRPVLKKYHEQQAVELEEAERKDNFLLPHERDAHVAHLVLLELVESHRFLPFLFLFLHLDDLVLKLNACVISNDYRLCK